MFEGNRLKKREQGSIGDLLGAGLCILAMLTIMMSFLNNMELIQKKAQTAQIARKYMLRMETCGYLEPEKEHDLTKELEQLGITNLSLEGTTKQAVTYGDIITLKIVGKLKGGYDIVEEKVSTAKN